jgi:hypothetical protein
LIRKTSLLSDRSDGVRSSSRQGIGAQPRDPAIFIAVQRDHVSMLGDCVSIATLPSRPNLGAILPLHDVRYHARALVTLDYFTLDCSSLTARASRRVRKTFSANEQSPRSGGARRDRTDDLLLAKQALSQLSYGPGPSAGIGMSDANKMVGLGRFELPTSRLSSARSNQLSYKPKSLRSYGPATVASTR